MGARSTPLTPAPVPVSRAADYAKTGAGTVRLSDDSPHTLLGNGTKFTTQVKPRSQIVLPKSLGYATCAIEEVISDTEIRIKGEFTVPSKDGNSNIKATNRVREGQGEGVGYKILPHIDQDKTFGAVFQALNKGGCIGIFPEGGSHDRTDFLPLKAGFSIMALGAMATHPGLDVKIVPVGLSYFNAHKFRSRAVVEFGTPITVDAELVAMYKQGGSKKREACGKLLEQAHDGLRAVTLRAPDFETLQVGSMLFDDANPAGYPGRPPPLPRPRPAPLPRPDCPAQQVLHGGLPPLPARARNHRAPRARPQVQPSPS